MELRRAVKNKDHEHLVLLDPTTRRGTTSADSDHVHEVMMAEDGTWFISMSMDHEHELADLPAPIPANPPGDKNDPDPVSTDLTRFNTNAAGRELAIAIKVYKALQDRETRNAKEMKEARELREGEHWTKEQCAALDAEGRAHLVLNYTGGMVDLLKGYFSQNRRDPRAYPVEAGDSKVCDVLNLAMKQIAYQSKYDARETMAFEDEIVTGRAALRLSMKFDEDVRGVVDIRRLDPAKVRVSAHKEIDASDAEALSIEEWMVIDRLKALYPDRARQLEQATQLIGDVDLKTFLSQPEATDWGAEILGTLSDPNFTSLDGSFQAYKLIELERIEYRVAHVILSDDGSVVQEVKPGWAARAKTVPGLSVVKVPKSRMRRTVFVGSVLLDDFYPDFPWSGFSVVLAHAYLNDKAEFYGKVRAAADPQREVNKRHSQVVDIMNKCAGYGRFYDDQTFDDPSEEQAYRDHGGKPGFIGKIRDTAKPPVQIEGTKVPAEVLKLEEVSIEQFYRSVNINPQMFGMTEYAQESGRSQQIKQRAALLGNEFLFDNFYQTKRTLWSRVVKMIQEHYTADRLARMCVAAAAREQTDLTLGGQDMDPSTPETMAAIQTILQTADLTQYDVVIGEGPMSPTTMEAERMLWMEFSQYNPGQVPPELIVQLSSLAHKDKWARIMAEKAQAQAQAEQAKAQADIIKAGRGVTEASIGTNLAQGPGTQQ